MKSNLYINDSKTAFTLAEVLITLLIIGVVSSLVIPSLINNTQDAELRTSWKKVYGIVDQATRQMMLDNGGTLKGLFTDQNTVISQYSNYFIFSKKCVGTYECWHLNNNWFWNNGSPINQNSNSAIILNNGAMVLFSLQDINCGSTLYSGNIQKCLNLIVDINGFKTPNRIDKDLFYIYVMENRILPRCAPGDSCSPDNCGSYNGACSAKYLYQ